jgi:AraC family transcriptional regulator
MDQHCGDPAQAPAPADRSKQFVTRERVVRAQQLIRKTSWSFIDAGLHVGYCSPSHFAESFRRAVGVTPKGFRNSL